MTEDIKGKSVAQEYLHFDEVANQIQNAHIIICSFLQDYDAFVMVLVDQHSYKFTTSTLAVSSAFSLSSMLNFNSSTVNCKPSLSSQSCVFSDF